MNVPIRVSGALSAVTLMAVSLCTAPPSATAASSQPDLTRYYTQKIGWHPCGQDPDSEVRQESTHEQRASAAAQGSPHRRAQGPVAECGSVKVPYTYAKPSQGDMTLALMRYRARDQNSRLGSLLINFGGPGGSGLEGLAGSGPDGFGKAGTRYDLVSFDPRGVGASTPVRCGEADEVPKTVHGADSAPENLSVLGKYLAEQKAALATCAKLSGPILPWVGTVNVARDLDVMRQALGDEKLNYLGISYGTKIGAVYAHQFPKKVGRMALDGVDEPAPNMKDTSLAQATGYQKALEHSIEQCAQRGADCPLGTDPGRAMTGVVTGLNRLDEHPMKLPDGTELTREGAQSDIMALLRSRDEVDTLPAMLAVISQGKAPGRETEVAEDIADEDEGAERNGTYDNSSEAFVAVNCADTSGRYTEKEIDDAYPEFVKASPVFGGEFVTGMATCNGWPEAGDDTSHDVSAPGAATIVMTTALYDPATPHPWLKQMAKAVGPAVTITDNGAGHGLYVATKALCVRRHFDAFFLEGTLPKDGTVCDDKV
ncbi:alpha/beta hydrolase [Streptomyces sp. cg36]|uniref:alpha/beta hydrolase n=1 Tax=Streptomyces sp. cg36 TaxID=3238798 RepID=UPI0034E1A1C6